MHWFGMRVDVCAWWGVQVEGGGFATYRRDTETDGSDELEDGYRSCRHGVFTGCSPMTLESGVGSRESWSWVGVAMQVDVH
jgi:hypothetical protein